MRETQNGPRSSVVAHASGPFCAPTEEAHAFGLGIIQVQRRFWCGPVFNAVFGGDWRACVPCLVIKYISVFLLAGGSLYDFFPTSMRSASTLAHDVVGRPPWPSRAWRTAGIHRARLML